MRGSTELQYFCAYKICSGYIRRWIELSVLYKGSYSEDGMIPLRQVLVCCGYAADSTLGVPVHIVVVEQPEQAFYVGHGLWVSSYQQRLGELTKDWC